MNDPVRNILPKDVLFDRYFREDPEWSVRTCYLGREEPLNLTATFSRDTAQWLEELRDLLNKRYMSHGLCVDHEQPVLHFDYIRVQEPHCPAEKAPPRKNAIAFVHENLHFIGITMPLVTEIVETAVRLARSGSITRLFDTKPHQATGLYAFLLITMVEFVFLHELGHHVHGHQGQKASKTATRYYDETVAAVEDSLVSQAKEVEADGYAINALLEKLRGGPALAAAVFLLNGRRADVWERHVYLATLLAAAGAFMACGLKSFALDRSHPPQRSKATFRCSTY